MVTAASCRTDRVVLIQGRLVIQGRTLLVVMLVLVMLVLCGEPVGGGR